MESTVRHEVPKWAKVTDRFNNFMIRDLFGGPKHIKLAWIINTHKAGTPIFILALMLIYSNFSIAAWIYLALHGSYGLSWLLKHLTFRDSKWEMKITYGSAIFAFLLLGTYWIAPYLLISRPALSPWPAWPYTVCIALHTLGAIIMISADCQKYFTFKFQKGLITGGLFRYTRHPNYLGEMMIYASYAILARHWLPWLILTYWWILIFLVNMLVVESSISRYPEWKDYKRKTAFLIPWLF